MMIGGFAMKKQMLDDRRFPKLHLNLQRLLQVELYISSCLTLSSEHCLM